MSQNFHANIDGFCRDNEDVKVFWLTSKFYPSIFCQKSRSDKQYNYSELAITIQQLALSDLNKLSIHIHTHDQLCSGVPVRIHTLR